MVIHYVLYKYILYHIIHIHCIYIIFYMIFIILCSVIELHNIIHYIVRNLL